MTPRAPGESSAESPDLAGLRLLHLADSALPIGSLAHSFGLETLVAGGILQVRNLPDSFRAYLEEAGAMEAVFCREAFRLALPTREIFPCREWLSLNERLSALKPAREARAASITLGQNFLTCVLGVHDLPVLREVLAASKAVSASACEFTSAAFGLASGALGFAEELSVLSFLHQQLASLVSACQRLLPLGQTAAARILWDLKSAILEVATRSAACGVDEVCCFTPLLDWGAMEHPALTTRLFVS